ncbi:MAG: PilX N-terminal domain-containing pilus assembly protein [Pseudomonadota bacterium]
MKRQHGLVLVFALLVLLSITILGVTAINSSILQSKMASSIERKSFAFDAAEAAVGGVVFESEDETLLRDPNVSDPLTEAREDPQFDTATEELSCFDDSRTTRNATSNGMSVNTVHTAEALFSANPPVSAWSRTVFVREQACRGSSNVVGGSNITCHVFMIRGCGQLQGSNYAVANTLAASVFAPANDG